MSAADDAIVCAALACTAAVFWLCPRGRFCLALVTCFGALTYVAETVAASRSGRPLALGLGGWTCVLCTLGSFTGAVAHFDTRPRAAKAE